MNKYHLRIKTTLSLTEGCLNSNIPLYMGLFADWCVHCYFSPVGSRPPSPKSDTEFENRKYDATSQTMLTGDNLQTMDNVQWRWGELPESTAPPDTVTAEGSEAKPPQQGTAMQDTVLPL